LEGSLLWTDPKDAEIKLSIEEKCAAYGSQTLKEIFENRNKSVPSARQNKARAAGQAGTKKVQAKGKGKVTKSRSKDKGKAKASAVDEDEDSDVDMEDIESEDTLTPPPPHQAPAKRPRTQRTARGINLQEAPGGGGGE
jgi:hypothetical protein